MDTGQCLPTAPAGEGVRGNVQRAAPSRPRLTRQLETVRGSASGLARAESSSAPAKRQRVAGGAYQCRSSLVLAFPAPSQEPPGGSDLGRERGRRRGPGHSQCGAPGEVPAAVTPASSLHRRGNCSWSAGSFLLLLAGSGLGRLSQETAQERDFFSSCKTTALSKSAALYFKKGKRRFPAGHRRLLVAVV